MQNRLVKFGKLAPIEEIGKKNFKKNKMTNSNSFTKNIDKNKQNNTINSQKSLVSNDENINNNNDDKY